MAQKPIASIRIGFTTFPINFVLPCRDSFRTKLVKKLNQSGKKGISSMRKAALLILLLAIFAAGCGSSDDTTGSSGSDSGGGKIDVVGYSTPESVYEEALEPGFEGTSAGADVSFSNSFGASGDQSRAVVAGQPA